MKKSVILITAGLMGLVMFSCNKNAAKTDNDRVAVRFSTETTTRASGETWKEDDRIGIRMLDDAETTSGGYANKEYSAVSGGTSVNFIPTGGENMFYPTDGSTVNFSAYYPYAASLSGNIYAVDVEDQSSPADIDLLWAKTADGYDKDNTHAVQLAFAHMLSKFILKPTAHASIGTSLEGMAVTIKGMNSAASFDIVAGSISGEIGDADIIPYTVTDGVLYEAIVLPSDITADNVTVKFTVGSETFTWSIPSTSFVKGKEHLWEIAITRGGVSGIQASIKDWETGTGGTGTAE